MHRETLHLLPVLQLAHDLEANEQDVVEEVLRLFLKGKYEEPTFSPMELAKSKLVRG